MTKTIRRVESAAAAPARVLAFHRVAPPTAGRRNLTVTADSFSEQMQVLFRTAFVDAQIDAIASHDRRLHRRGRHHFAITFDDGYVDNLTTALPILEQNDLPVTVFISTAFIGKPYFWWDRLDELTSNADQRSTLVNAACSLQLLAEQQEDELAVATPDQINRALERRLERLVLEERNDLLDELSQLTGCKPLDSSARPLNESELVRLASHPLVTIGCHGHRHLKLGQSDRADAAKDILHSKQALAAVLGPRQHTFAYPHGSHDKTSVSLVKEAGFSLAFTTDSRPVSILDSKWRLPRIATADIGGEEFARRRRLPI